MQDLIQSMTTFMELRGYAKSTQKNYVAHIQRFHKFCGKHPASVGYDEVRAFLHHAIKVRKLSPEYLNSAYSAIKLLYQSVLRREWNMVHIPRLKKSFKLPTILTPQEVHQIIDATPNLKHKAILSTTLQAFELVKPHIFKFQTFIAAVCVFSFVRPKAVRIGIPFCPKKIFCCFVNTGKPIALSTGSFLVFRIQNL